MARGNVTQFDTIAVKEIIFSDHGAPSATTLVSGMMFMSGAKLRIGGGAGTYEVVTHS